MRSSSAAPQHRFYAGVFLLSAGTLVYETALTRVLSFTIWHHFAYVVLGTALLGFGASGTYLAVRPPKEAGDLAALARTSVSAAVSGIGFLAFVSAVRFDPLRVFAHPTEFILLLSYLVGAALPFFFTGLAISRALSAAVAQVHTLYFWDLVGGGLGCALSIALMNALGPPGAMLVACAAMSGAGIVFAGPRRSVAAIVFSAFGALAATQASHIPFKPAASKHLTQYLSEKHMVLAETRWNALFRSDLTRCTPETRWGNADEWGLSSKVEVPVQSFWGIITHDGSAGVPLYDLRLGKLDFLDNHLLKFPYLVANRGPRVLVIGVGGGRDIFAALRYGATNVTGVELDQQTVDFVRGPIADLARDVFESPKVRLVVGEGRHFIEQSHDRYDVIQITGVDTLAAQTSGAYVLAENFLYTTNTFAAYLDHLNPGGVISIATGEWRPDEPQTTGRMAMVAREALLTKGLEPSSRIVLFHSDHLLTEVIVRREPFTAEETSRFSREAERLAFIPLWLPGHESHPAFTKLMTTVGAAHQAVLDRLRYVVDPVTDERPFFFRFHRWSRLFEAADYGPFLASALGQLLLVLLLACLTLLGALLTLAPLFFFLRRGLERKGASGVLVYFLSLGLGFMLLEISLIQRFALYLGYPTYSMSVALFSLLVSTGVGSYLSRRWTGHERTVLPLALAGLAVLLVVYQFGVPPFMAATLGTPLPVRIVLTASLLFPLGALLGIFFPLGIRRAEKIHPDLVPWAWGINGCASVVASVLAVILAMEWGFGVVLALAMSVYVAGVAALLLLAKESAPGRAR